MVEFALLCKDPFQQRFAAAVALYERALADRRRTGNATVADRFNAAGAAVRAGTGDGADVPAAPAERAALRAKALAWLRTNLALHQKQAASTNPVVRTAAGDLLARWLREPDLSAVRPGIRRIGLPAAERAAWDAFWVDVTATIAAVRKSVQRELAPPPRPAKGP